MSRAMSATAQCWVNLSLVPGLGLTTLWRLVNHFSSPEAVFQAKPNELRCVPGVQERHLAGLLCWDGLRNPAECELERLERLGGRGIVYDDPAYPSLLRQLPDSPPVLYVIGDVSLLQEPALAMVGSRSATGYGRRTAFELAGTLARAGLVVVSGLAAGIDAESHRGALAAGGKTVAILGCGLDRIYPRQNKEVYEEIKKKGLLVSEYPLGTKPDGFRFPARNRIIAGMSRGVVVVEAARKSGSLITAQIALDTGREVFAVPGQMDSFKSEGSHLLIKSGAGLVMSADDILAEMNMRPSAQEEVVSVEGLEGDARLLLQFLESYPVARDFLVEKTGLSAGRIHELSLLLELEGLVEVVPGDQLRRIN